MSENVDKSPDDSEEEHITESERVEAAALTRLKSRMVYEIIRQEGRSELSRPQASIWWSGIAAGIGISISLAMEAMLRVGLPDTEWRPVVESFGYTAGFLLVILGRLQLFTENTVTAVLPTLADPCRKTLVGTARLWGTVFLANMVGTAIAAAFLTFGKPLEPDVAAATLDISFHVAEWGAWETFIKALPAGFLIAALVWMLPTSEGGEVLVIAIMIYMIALGDFTHVIVGSVELFLVVFDGQFGLLPMAAFRWLPTLLGNVVGGTALFAVLAYAQVQEELEEEEAGHRGDGEPGDDQK
ncbi:MAG: formate/nitrite transporter family protein, partial [Henriciella sp.]|uniref:formate/nitrite transporter family protein n=1 Tax=Henriciella sp. TaxID=1968823 RepID=UPI003C74D5FD